MPIPTYTTGYPPDGSSLGQTKSTIRNNLDGTFETLAIDHVNNNGQPGSQPAGYHTLVHQVTQTSVATLTNYNQIFSGVPGTLSVNSVTTPAIPPGGDTQLYSLSSAGILSQLTGGVLAGNGYAWLGGILVQWGRTTGATGTVTFTATAPNNVNFPHAIFNVQATPNDPAGLGCSVNNLSTTGFTYTTNPSAIAIYWLAIGY